MKFRIRARLLLFLWGVFFLILLLPSVYYNRQLRDEFLEDTGTRLSRELAMVENFIAPAKNTGTFGLEDLNKLLKTASENLGVRFTYVGEGGRVIADSDFPAGDVADLENHASRPEIAAANTEGAGVAIRYSGTLNIDLLYVARKTAGSGEIPAGVLRAAVPLSSIFYRLGNVSTAQSLVILIGLAGFAALSFWLVTHTSRSVAALSKAAESIGTGEVRIPHLFQPRNEFYPLAMTLKETSERVEYYIKTITRQKLQLESVLDGVEEAILLLDARGRVELANKGARKLFPLSHPIEGRRPLELVRSHDLQVACERVLARRIESWHGEIEIDPNRHCHCSIGLTEHSPRDYGAIVTLHDISDLKRLEKVRRDFVANASHELRTPLTSMKGYLELLDGEQDARTRDSYIKVVLRNTDEVIQLVNDLLQLAKVEDESRPVELQAVDAGAAVMEAWKTCAHVSAEKKVSLVNGLPEAGPLVFANPGQLCQVFRNLLENAIKFSPPGSSVDVTAQEEGETVRFAVSDCGPGIPKQDQDRIFERFFRVERSRTKESGGTGLGLAICRHILRSHGGRIWVESPREGEQAGTTFFFTLRRAGAEVRRNSA